MANKKKQHTVDEELKDKVLEAEEQEAEENANAETEADDEKAEDAKTDDKKAEAESKEAESERYMRLMAEFQNFKKRALKEKSDIHAYANEKIIGELLPVLDNFERALDANAEDDPEAFAKGMSLIFEQMLTAMKNAGLAEIKALGEDFDPGKHNAVMTEDSDEYDSGKVNKVLQKGYTLNDKVIRPTMVSVSK